MTAHPAPARPQSMHSARAFYFFYFAAQACLAPYLILHLDRWDISGKQAGLLMAMFPMIRMIGAPAWSVLADAIQRHRAVLMLTICLTLAGTYGLSKATTFTAFLVLIPVFAFVSSPMIPLIDNTVMQALGDERGHYGRIRLFGTISWGITSPIIGLLIDLHGLSWSFFAFFLLIGMLFMVSCRLPIQPMHVEGGMWHGVRRLMRDRRWYIFLSVMFVAGLALAQIHVFLFLYLERLGASRQLMGWSMSVATACELPVYFFGARLIARLGARGLIEIALLALGVRLLAMGFITDPLWVLPIQSLHALTFAMAWLAGVSRAHALAPHGLGATAQGLLTGVYFGLGHGLGALLGGLMLDFFTISQLYRFTGCAVLIAFLAYAAVPRSLLRPPNMPPDA